MKVGELIQGQFAITDSGMGILCLSDLSFVPYDQENANVVHLANGIGGFPFPVFVVKFFNLHGRF